MLGGYTLGIDTPFALSTLITALEFSNPSGLRAEVIEAKLYNKDDEASRQEAWEFVRKTAAGTGTAGVARANNEGDAAFGGSVRYNMTAEGTVSVVFPSEGWNIIGNGWIWQPTPSARIFVSEGGILGLRPHEAPESAFNCGGHIKIVLY